MRETVAGRADQFLQGLVAEFRVLSADTIFNVERYLSRPQFVVWMLLPRRRHENSCRYMPLIADYFLRTRMYHCCRVVK